MTLPKPKHLEAEYGAQFSDPSVASAYQRYLTRGVSCAGQRIESGGSIGHTPLLDWAFIRKRDADGNIPST